MTKVIKFTSCFKSLFLGLMLLAMAANSAECALLNVGGEYNHNEYLQYCSPAEFTSRYEAASCWACDIIDAMFDGFKVIIVEISKRVVPLCKLVLTLGAALWIAMYLLKSLGSFAVQNPGKILDGLSIFMFKVIFVYLMITPIPGTKTAVTDNLVEMIVNPILSIGMDIGRSFSEWASLPAMAFYNKGEE